MMFEATDSFSTMLRKGDRYEKTYFDRTWGPCTCSRYRSRWMVLLYTSCRVRRRQRYCICNKDKQAFGNGFRSGKPICRCCGTAGNGSGKDRKRSKGKRSSGKDRSGSQERAASFSVWSWKYPAKSSGSTAGLGSPEKRTVKYIWSDHYTGSWEKESYSR